MEIKNTSKVERIVYEDTLVNYCPIGKSLYRNNLVITINPNEILPDYIELHERIRGLEGKHYIIEDVVDLVLKIVVSYKPTYAEVKTTVDDANHPKVTISKTYSIRDDYNAKKD